MRAWLRASLDEAVADRSLHLLAAVLIAFGVVFRLAHYLAERSLWIDEAALALNVLHRSPTELAQTLDFDQAAPLAFLLAVKAAVLSFGDSEVALRLFPLICGLASLPVFYVAARTVAGRSAALAGVLLFACANGLIYYSAELKQYGCDVLAVVVLLAIALQRTTLTPRRFLAVSLAAAATMWFSHASLFVFASVAVTYAGAFAYARRWTDVLRVGAASLIWLVALGLFYVVSVRDAARIQEKIQHSTRLGADAQVWLNELIGHMGNHIGLPESQALVPQLVRVVAAALAVVGMVALLRRRPAVAFMLGLPILFLLIAVELKLYPLLGRTLVFATPIVLLLVTQGIGTAAGMVRRREAVLAVGLALTALVAAYPAAAAVREVANPVGFEENKPLLRELVARWRPGDTLYVHWGTLHAFRYYLDCGCIDGLEDSPPLSLAGPATGPALVSPSLVSRSPSFVVGRFSLELVPVKEEIDRLRGRKRVWILYSHVSNKDEERSLYVDLPRYLDRIGERRALYARRYARLYLYDFSRPS